jgi:hypothetical protein
VRVGRGGVEGEGEGGENGKKSFESVGALEEEKEGEGEEDGRGKKPAVGVLELLRSPIFITFGRVDSVEVMVGVRGGGRGRGRGRGAMEERGGVAGAVGGGASSVASFITLPSFSVSIVGGSERSR